MKTCSECTHMLLEKEHEHDNDGKFWCEFKGDWKRPEDAECWNFCQAYSRDSSTSESKREYSKIKQEPGPCFITTIVCTIMGLEDKNIYLMLLRKFRNNYLQKNANTIPILEEYDFIGPVISKCIYYDKDRNALARDLFLNHLVPVFDDIANDDYKGAIKKYTAMVKGLIAKYNLGTLSLTIPTNNYDYRKDYSMYGHGRKK